jgi:hypothetical protein
VLSDFEQGVIRALEAIGAAIERQAAAQEAYNAQQAEQYAEQMAIAEEQRKAQEQFARRVAAAQGVPMPGSIIS